MIRTVCALVLLSLIVDCIYTNEKNSGQKEHEVRILRKTIVKRPVRKKIEREELVFCCEHCTEAYVD